MSTAPLRRRSPAEYLQQERLAEYKSQYFQGETFAMTGASRKHNLIATNMITAIANALGDSPCEVYCSDMRVRVNWSGLYTYPDVSIVCDHPEFVDEHVDTLLNPKVLIEILSDSTEKYDRGFKASHYRQIESLQEYAFVSQSEPRIEVYQRQLPGTWLLREATALDDSIRLESVGVTLKLSDVYRRIGFETPQVPE